MDSELHLREREWRASLEAGAYDDVATRFMEQHADTIFAFLVDRLRSTHDADEAFAQFAEDFWRGLPRFAMCASLRSWAFTVARHAAIRHQRSPHRRRAHNEPLPDDSRMLPAAPSSRTHTPPYQQTALKDRLRALRRRLSEEDQTLLVLRVDQRLSWLELADVLAGEGGLPDPAERARRAAQLRQRFKRLKDQLRAWVEAEHSLDV